MASSHAAVRAARLDLITTRLEAQGLRWVRMLMVRHHYSLFLTVSLALAGSVFAGRGAGLKVGELKCEYRVTPRGLDTPQPRLSWRLESPERGQRQTAYQVLAATTP